MIYFDQPNEFNKKFEIVACFIEVDGKFVILHRRDHKSEGNTWGLPAGKVDQGESNLQAIKREIKEETGFDVGDTEVRLLKTLYVKYPNYDFIYHMYLLPISKYFEVKIEKEEHKDFRWVTPEEALNMNLIQDLDSCIKIHYKINNK